MEYEDVKWIQLMQPGSVGNMVMNISVAWEHKTIRLHVLCQRIMDTEGTSDVLNLCVWSPEKSVSLLVTLKGILYQRNVLL